MGLAGMGGPVGVDVGLAEADVTAVLVGGQVAGVDQAVQLPGRHAKAGGGLSRVQPRCFSIIHGSLSITGEEAA